MRVLPPQQNKIGRRFQRQTRQNSGGGFDRQPIPVVDSDGNDRSLSSCASASAILIAGADKTDLETRCTSDWPHQRKQRPDDARLVRACRRCINDGMMLGMTSLIWTVCVRKISDWKLLQKLERMHGRIVAAATRVSVAARLLDGIVLFCCKLMHARMRWKLLQKMGRVHGRIVMEVE
jgi:hypothetical protein